MHITEALYCSANNMSNFTINSQKTREGNLIHTPKIEDLYVLRSASLSVAIYVLMGTSDLFLYDSVSHVSLREIICSKRSYPSDVILG